MNLKLRNPLAVFDLETTGLSTIKDRIVEISIVKIMPSGEKIIKTKRLNPTIPISAESSMIHGIYEEDIKDCPTFKQVAKEIAQFLEGADLCGFNVLRFDLPLLVEEFLRADVNFDPTSRKVVDAQKIFHMMEPRTLGAAYKFYCDKSLENAHSAEADTLATFEVLDAQVAKYEGVKMKNDKGEEYTPIENDIDSLHKLSSNNMIDYAGRMVYNKQGIAVFNFGKHKNKPVTEVLKREPAYYDWIMNNEFPLNTKQKLTEIKLKTMFS
ncbi:3'-5' exonuclease [Sediminitomix flava]|uniref:DNA polymerase-3 subunit epsilon n=1 Tax=Sediminitomix flava TaxID=379075 RepID=A0A315Z9L1_SEDFL|nr:3'-5' exonuclease [Sediminitomix flava]PWJ42090.1 DNA polymerase-3 subunit epsilon [Sediminitomix flava]